MTSTEAERPEVNVAARWLTEGMEIYRYGEWHPIVKVAGAMTATGPGLTLRTATGRHFIINNPELLVAAR